MDTTQNPFEAPTSTPQDAQASTPPTKEAAEHSFGPIIGILIIVALLVFGGLYFWGASLKNVDSIAPSRGFIPADELGTSFEVIDPATEEYTLTDAEFEALIGAQGGATLDTALDDLGDLDNLDAEFDALELEL